MSEKKNKKRELEYHFLDYKVYIYTTINRISINQVANHLFFLKRSRLTSNLRVLPQIDFNCKSMSKVVTTM